MILPERVLDITDVSLVERNLRCNSFDGRVSLGVSADELNHTDSPYNLLTFSCSIPNPFIILIGIFFFVASIEQSITEIGISTINLKTHSAMEQHISFPVSLYFIALLEQCELAWAHCSLGVQCHKIVYNWRTAGTHTTVCQKHDIFFFNVRLKCDDLSHLLLVMILGLWKHISDHFHPLIVIYLSSQLLTCHLRRVSVEEDDI